MTGLLSAIYRKMPRYLVLGASDIGSAVAARLVVQGRAVVLHDLPNPPHARRGMAFTDAFFDEPCRLGGVAARRLTSLASIADATRAADTLPVTDEVLDRVLDVLRPDVLVDARMHKHRSAPALRGLAPITIGLGPGFVAGLNADLVIETAWGNALGQVIREGGASDTAGEPRALGGHGRERYVYAPAAGVFRTTMAIGGLVTAGMPVGRIGDAAVQAPLAGILRGLTHDGAAVTAGTKIVEVDARGDPAAAFGIGERPARIAEGVLAAITAAAATR